MERDGRGPRAGSRRRRQSEGVHRTLWTADVRAPLRDEDVVVRLGYSRPTAIQRSARNHYLRFGIYGLSVYCLPGMSGEEIAARLPHPHEVFRESTVGRLRRDGFDVAGPGPDGHCIVVLADVDEETCRRLERCFGPARPRRR